LAERGAQAASAACPSVVGPRRGGKGGRGPIFWLRAESEVVNSNACHFILTFFQKQLFVFSYVFDIYSNLNQRDNLFREKSEF
jgi:hypothetical protein